jgi:ABC-2 type transport system permease protein
MTPAPEVTAQSQRERRLRKRFNGLGWWTLYQREVLRFAKVYNQTVLAPVVTSLLYLVIFALALEPFKETVSGTPYLQFLAPGLIVMAITQNAFANTSSSLMIAKIQGTIVDLLMAPLTPWELTSALALGGVTRGLAVGAATAIAMLPVVPVSVHSIGLLLYFAITSALMLSLLGIAGGIWAEKFDHIAAVTNFIVTPLSFLSGTFYSIGRLPEWIQVIAHLNPFFYMIDGFRFACNGRSDTDPLLGVLILATVNAGLLYLCWRMFDRGYKLKA